MIPKFLKDAEDLLADRCTDYLIVCCYDDKVIHTYNKSTSAFGMAELIKKDIEYEWEVSPESTDGI